jgi:hypothetical protein
MSTQKDIHGQEQVSHALKELVSGCALKAILFSPIDLHSDLQIAGYKSILMNEIHATGV